MRQASIGEWLRLAYQNREGCPPPEAYLEAELAALEPGARERLERHAAGCAACAAERALARSFEAPGPIDERTRRERDLVVRRLERRAPHRRSGGWLERLLPGGPVLAAPAFRLAAAVVLIVGAGFLIRHAATPPPLGEAPGDTVVRGSAIEAVRPVGEVAGAPRELAWEAVEGAVEYRVSVVAVDGVELWRSETEAESVPVPAEVASRLEPAVTYVWRVEALDAGGARLAWSPEVRFRIAAAGEQPTP